jgi:hypothetical protein
MTLLRLGVVVTVEDDGELVEIEEAQTGARYTAPVRCGRAMNSGIEVAAPYLGHRHAQGPGCELKAPEVGDAVCFEIGSHTARIRRWGYVNRFLLATERSHPSRFLPSLL